MSSSWKIKEIAASTSGRAPTATERILLQNSQRAEERAAERHATTLISAVTAAFEADTADFTILAGSSNLSPADSPTHASSSELSPADSSTHASSSKLSSAGSDTADESDIAAAGPSTAPTHTNSTVTGSKKRKSVTFAEGTKKARTETGAVKKPTSSNSYPAGSVAMFPGLVNMKRKRADETDASATPAPSAAKKAKTTPTTTNASASTKRTAASTRKTAASAKKASASTKKTTASNKTAGTSKTAADSNTASTAKTSGSSKNTAASTKTPGKSATAAAATKSAGASTASTSNKATKAASTSNRATKSASTSKATGTSTTPTANSTTGAKSAATRKTSTKKAAASKDSSTKSTATKTTASKRKAEDDDEDTKDTKKPRKATTPTTRRGRAPKAAATINEAPTAKLKVFVFGENGNGELGLGHQNLPDKKVTNVTRPRLNPNLLPDKVGVVQVAAGGMHAVALTRANEILTWGVNDQGALGRATKDGDVLEDVDGADDSADEEYVTDATGRKKWPVNTGLNPLEAAPGKISLAGVPEGTTWTQVAAGDSITMAVTSTGLVYGCGTFRSNDGILGFSQDVLVQSTFTQVTGLKEIVSLACGDNHVLALDKKGNVFTWGSGQQNQLGRRIIERNRLHGLVPSQVGLPKGKTTYIAAGPYHSFALDKAGKVWAWGLNSFGETGLPTGAGEDGALVLHPERVGSLADHHVTALAGGAHHSLAATADGAVLAWGRCDGGQAGIEPEAIPRGHFFVDAAGAVNERLILTPARVTAVEGSAVLVAAGTDTSFAVTAAGKAFSWGFSENFQTGQGSGEDVEEATLVDNTAVRAEKLVWAGAGGQYGVLTSEA